MHDQNLVLIPRRSPFGFTYSEVVSGGDQTIAHTVFEIVAATLAEPLRKALREHRDDPEAHAAGSTWCGGCEYLWSLLPDSDKVAIA